MASLGIASRDPRLAIRLAESQGSVESGQLTELIATQWSRDNPSEAGRWVEGLSRPDQARYAYRVADAYVAQKPTEALSLGFAAGWLAAALSLVVDARRDGDVRPRPGAADCTVGGESGAARAGNG